MTRWGDRLALALVRQAGRIMPREHADWARAMSAEVAFIVGAPEALHFAVGCLRAACLARIASLLDRVAPEAWAGCTAGCLFVGHAAINESGRWPWMWPAVGGVLVALAQLKKPAAPSAWAVFRAGLKAGSVCAVIFFSVGLGVVWLLARPTIQSKIDLLAFGAAGGLLLTAVIAGLATELFAFRRKRP